MTTILEITGAAHGGCGVGRVEGRACFVPYALPGDVLRVRITRQSRGVLWGSIEEILESSPHRIPVACPVYGRCGGCSWLHFGYPAQSEWKRRIVQDCLQRIAGLETSVGWAETPELRLGYRTRAEFHSDGSRWGFFNSGSRDVTNIERCPLCHERLNAALSRLRATRFTGSVEVTVNPDGEQVLVWTRSPSKTLTNLFPSVNTIRDRERARFFLDGVPIVNGTFSQSSLLLNRLLVATVRDLLGAPARILDLYCGNGNLSLGTAEHAFVLGLDHNRFAVQAATACGRGEYRRGDESDFCRALREETWDVVILDPPRTGAKRIAEALAACRARAIIYVSCDPATLARDLKTLAAAGWHTDRIIAVDMFPHTPHIETVTQLNRDSHHLFASNNR
ncbi:MAG: class I SAM-dependent RNA methyltransferase [Candidatus Hydrogenedentes bacterium]|nr:class I SAM-dependent RNA methyltransferase [Candidatus Hydrogenedentota bacterium]